MYCVTYVKNFHNIKCYINLINVYSEISCLSHASIDLEKSVPRVLFRSSDVYHIHSSHLLGLDLYRVHMNEDQISLIGCIQIGSRSINAFAHTVLSYISPILWL